MDPYAPRPRTAPNLGLSAIQHLHPELLKGCCIEAERAEIVALQLQGLRNFLSNNLHPHLTGLINEIRTTSLLLRDLADKSQVHFSQVTAVFDYLNIILPCLYKSLQDITAFYEDKRDTKERRWRKMYHSMGKELSGLTLPARFIMYNQYLMQLQYLLVRSPYFDFKTVESLRLRILQLREARDIPPPTPVRTDLIRRGPAIDFWNDEANPHWSEAVFSQPLPSGREFKKRGSSNVFGPCKQLGHLYPFPQDVKILVKRSFDDDRVSVIFFQGMEDKAPYILARERKPNAAWVTMHGVHELRIEREEDSVLGLYRWSRSESRPKPWVSLAFITWEEMVLFYCTFLVLKARSPRTIDVHPDEYALRKEKRLFQAQIKDAGFHHCLMVFEDEITGGRRLHAAAWEGELVFCPIWTAFVPPKTSAHWASRRSRRCVQLRRVQLYTFCEEYKAHRQRKGKHGLAFELEFVHGEAAMRFKELFGGGGGAATVPTLHSAEKQRGINNPPPAIRKT
ncbi:hypothetical protein F5X96DRAFT_676516 [Biscogniauxia mediterranea]|nr:hypothetical protein F5X96DRAFT_676516 [Biscogniauxia mediterranea]